MRLPRSEDIEKFAEAGYVVAQESARWSLTPWRSLDQDTRLAWVRAATEILSRVEIIQVEQRTTVYVPEIKFSEPK